MNNQPELTVSKNVFEGVGPFGFIWTIAKNSIIGLKSVFSWKFLFSILAMCAVWFGLSLAKLKWPNAYWVYISSLLTFAQGGIYGGLIGAIGGILGKTFIGCSLLRFMVKSTGATSGKVFEPADKSNKGSSLASWIIGLGTGLVLFNFTDYHMLKENSIIGLFMFIICLKMQSDPDNLTIGFLNSFAKGKPENPRAAKYAVAGTGWGFLTGFIMVWSLTGFQNLAYIVGAVAAVVGIILFVKQKK